MCSGAVELDDHLGGQTRLLVQAIDILRVHAFELPARVEPATERVRGRGYGILHLHHRRYHASSSRTPNWAAPSLDRMNSAVRPG